MPGLEIHFFGGSKLLLPSWRPGSKTNFVVAKLYVQFYAAVVLGCVDDRITNITQKSIKLTIPWIYGSSKCLLPHQNPGSKWESMVAFATKIPWISSPECMQNCLARVVLRAPRFSPSLSLLKQLHWLPVNYRIKFKLSTLTYRALAIHQPPYLASLLHFLSIARQLT